MVAKSYRRLQLLISIVCCCVTNLIALFSQKRSRHLARSATPLHRQFMGNLASFLQDEFPNNLPIGWSCQSEVQVLPKELVKILGYSSRVST